MNTFTFGDRLEREYFIEQVAHSGFRKDPKRSDLYATTYVHPVLTAYHIVMYRRELSADLYCGNKLLFHKLNQNEQSFSQLVTA
jgi:hypothetical protein